MQQNPKHIPKGFTVVQDNGFNVVDDFNKITLVAYNRQKKGSWEEGTILVEATKRPLTASVLDYLLDNPKIIPEEWKGKLACFWGTIYKAEQVATFTSIKGEEMKFAYEERYVRCLFYSGGVWKSDILSLNDEFGPTRLSAEVVDDMTIKQKIKAWFKKVLSIIKMQ